VPTYNAQAYIYDTIQSCVKQTYQNVSVVVIDDNSADNTISILKEFGRKITLVQNTENHGLPRNINRIILNDDSDFFIYLGHDDILPLDHVEIMLSEFDEKTVAVHCNSIEMNSNGETFDFVRNNKIQQDKSNDIIYELALNNFISIIGMMHRTESFKSIGGWDSSYDLYGEWLYYIKMAGVGCIKYTTKSHAFYRRHGMNISSSLYSVGRVKSFFAYKRRCRMLAYSGCNNLVLVQKLSFYKVMFIEALRAIKHVHIGNFTK